MLTTFRPKGKPIAASTRNTYYQIFNGALNAAVRAKRLLRNPFNEMEKSEKPKMPESVRSYMTIEEVRALIATPVQDGRVKNAYLFSCFCGLRISDIVGLKWKNVFVDNGQYRLAVAMQKTKEPIYLPLSNEALKWMPEREDKAADDHVFSLPSNINQYLAVGRSGRNHQAFYFSHGPAHIRDHDADARCGSLYRIEAAWSYLRENDTGVRQNHQPEKDEAVNLVNGLFD